MQITEVSADGREAVVKVLLTWIDLAPGVLKAQLKRQLRYTDRDYVAKEIKSMAGALGGPSSAKEHYFVASHDDEVLAVMKVGLWKNLVLNHIIAKPKAENARWPGGESPVSALMAKAESYARENGKTVVELNAEDPSLIPLYFYYGYLLIDEQLQAEVATALGLAGVGPDTWKAACKDVLAGLSGSRGDEWGAAIERIGPARASGFEKERMQKKVG
ncbi:hypothetical protein [Amycolatopsis kentuckyensis]|uniref:hypothetical protein n=1 Tax=Amycolatopsis kentuckyensis TaxID=218823 RepID=UPI000A3A177F|nr:hypothetical protein [Amycolatopsis kentuckyensis]